MPGSHSVVRKLSIVVILIVTLVIAATGLVNNLLSNHYALESARAVLKFNSESILSSINKLMMTRNNEDVSELIHDISEGSTVYQDVRLMSHYSGEIVASRLVEPGAILSEEDPSCAVCHEQTEPLGPLEARLDQVLTRSDGSRVFNVITPVLKQEGCQVDDCHAEEDSGEILGFLEAEYSLGDFDTLVSTLNASFMIAALAAILLGTVALWIMFKQILGKPIRQMLSGIQAIAGNDLSFRFNTDRDDELGLVADSFDHMAAALQTHQTDLRDAKGYLEGIVENSADIIITADSDGFIATVNRGAEQALGYHRNELIGQRVEVLFADPQERAVAIRRLETQDNVTNYDTRLLTKNKEIRNVLLTLSRLRDPEGRAIGTFGISKDVTTELDLQKRLVQSEKAAAIGQAVTAIQHAIKNMLNTLTGGSYLARHAIAKHDHKGTEEGFAMINEGISRIHSLSTNMLKYAKEWKLRVEIISLAPITAAVCNAIRKTAADEGITISCHIADHLPPVSCDPHLLHMALMDIASNAVDACSAKRYATDEAPAIALAAYVRNDGKFLVVEVRDNGIGMTEEIKAAVFTPFFTTKEEFGTGLGLPLVSRIVQLHGGEIEVESEPDKGSRFMITMPVPGMGTTQGGNDG